ncbi:MAG: hypothetical protein IT371_22950 [Deltaproteobacteria bacterium]|nr:hypothetical protein [Deltaproteobacteria bacterium]
MRERLLEVLCCPRTGSPFELHEAQRVGGQIAGGWLVSRATGARFPIGEGVPMLATDRRREARAQAGAGGRPAPVAAVPRRVGRRLEAVVDWLGERLLELHRPGAGAWVMQAGEAAGEFAVELATRHPELEVVALDDASSFSGEVTRAAGALENLHLVAGSLHGAGLAPGRFSWLVAHQGFDAGTAPRQAFSGLARHVAAEGAVALQIEAADFVRRCREEGSGSSVGRASLWGAASRLVASGVLEGLLSEPTRSRLREVLLPPVGPRWGTATLRSWFEEEGLTFSPHGEEWVFGKARAGRPVAT